MWDRSSLAARKKNIWAGCFPNARKPLGLGFQRAKNPFTARRAHHFAVQLLPARPRFQVKPSWSSPIHMCLTRTGLVWQWGHLNRQQNESPWSQVRCVLIFWTVEQLVCSQVNKETGFFHVLHRRPPSRCELLPIEAHPLPSHAHPGEIRLWR